MPRLAPLVLALLAIAPHSQAGWQVRPTIGVTETWTDNVGLRPEAHAHSQLVSQFSPGFTVAGETPRIKLSAVHEWHYFAYSGKRQPNTYDNQRAYQADGQARLVGDNLYLDASASRGVRAISAFGPQLSGSLWAMGNRAEVSSWRISPVFKYQFGSSANFSARYTRDEVEASRNLLESTKGESVAASLTSGRTFDDIGWRLDYSKQNLDNALAGPSSSEAALAGVRLRMSRTLALTASGGYDRYDFQSLGGRSEGRNWSAGFAWTPSARTTVQAAWGHRYFGPSGTLTATHRSRRSVWSLHYGDVITTTRAQFMLPATIDTASMLDKLFIPTIPDPVLRQQAVTAYMQATGLPASLADSINYFSNRYMRQKQLQAAAAFKLPRTSVLVSAFDVKRDALSLQETDSELLGSQLATLNENTHQRGLHSTFDYRLSPRSNVLMLATATRTESLATGRVAHSRMLRLGLTHKLSGGMRAAVELRRSNGGADMLGTQRYSENAISATLAMKF